MSNLTLNPEVATIITAAVSAVQSATRKMASSIDALVAADMRSTDFISPKSDGSTSSPEQFDGINTAIVAGFPKAAQALLARRNDFKRGLEKREGMDDTRAARQPKAAIDKLVDALTNVEKIVQANEWEFDVVDFMNCIVDAKIQAGIPHGIKTK